MLLSYLDLCDLVHEGVIDADLKHVNGASIDIRLGTEILVENPTFPMEHDPTCVVDLTIKPPPGENLVPMTRVQMDSSGYVLAPGQFCLAHSIETFNLPYSIACSFFLRSSIARAGLNALLAGWCLTGDTLVPLLDGTVRRLDDLEGEQAWVYSTDEFGFTVPGFASRIFKTKEVFDLVRVWLDSGESLTCTPEHLIRCRNGSWLEAANLKPGTPLMAIARRSCLDRRYHEYQEVYSPATKRRKWIQTHVMVDRYLNGPLPRDFVVHHADHNPSNNSPDNLMRMKRRDHILHHHETLSQEQRDRLSMLRSERASRQNEVRWDKQENRDKASLWARERDVAAAMRRFVSENKNVWYLQTLAGQVRNALNKLIDSGQAVTPENYLLAKRQNAPTIHTLEKVFGSFDAAIDAAEYQNHLVVVIEKIKSEHPISVYDMTVDQHHNFVLQSGIVVHNCDPGWNNAQLTLELHNTLRYHGLLLKPGLRIGQMVFHRTRAVPERQTYAKRGRYNNQSGVVATLGSD